MNDSQKGDTHNMNETTNTQTRTFYRLVVTIGGETIAHDNARETFADVIEKIGISRVASCTDGLIFESKPAAVSCRLRAGYWILVGGSIRSVHQKAEKLLNIKASLGIRDLHVETPLKS